MGLLDELAADPQFQLGLGLLAAGGPGQGSTGQRIAGALQGWQVQQAALQDQALKRQYMSSQMADNQSQAQLRNAQVGQLQQEQAMNAAIAERFRNRQGGLAPSGAASAPGVPMGSAPAPLTGGGAGLGNVAPGAMPAQRGGSAYPFTLDEIAMLTSINHKGASGLFDQFKYATDGVKREAGATYLNPVTGDERYFPKLGEGQVIGQNGVVGMAPGYIRSNAASKGAEADAVEAAKFPFTVGADRAKQLTGAALDTVRVVGDDNNEYFYPRLQVAGGGGMPGMAGAGGSGGNPGGGFMAGRNPISVQSQNALNDSWIKNSYQSTLDAGRAATESASNIQSLRNIDLNTGWGTETKATAANILAGLGIAPKNAEMFAANVQKFQSVAMDRLMKKQIEQKGTATEGDADRIGQTYVSLRNTSAANDFILDVAQAQANMDARKAAYYEAALPIAQQSKRGDLTEVDRQWRKVAGSIWADPILERWKKK